MSDDVSKTNEPASLLLALMTGGFRRTEHLRWAVDPGTSTAAPVLEQAWLDPATGAVEWRPVPIIIREPKE